MRQATREIKDKAVLEVIMQKAEVCRLAMTVDDIPYIVPMNFGYADNTLYFHCAAKGKKIEMLCKNDTVAFEIEGETGIIRGDELACKWSARYQSIVGLGKARFIKDAAEKLAALKIIMAHYTDQGDQLIFAEKPVELVCIFCVEITQMTGKQSQDYVTE
ncbi:pyridoxamine 5'-phosphate oxidase family protein [bacterium]|nr:pyridoxamine 5'-phosphate oxidase family protein [bacterium]